MTAATKLPKRLTSSEAYYDSAEGATKLWEAGFRPVDVDTVVVGNTVAYSNEFLGRSFGDLLTGRVLRVESPEADYPEWIEVCHTHLGGESITGCEAGTEVWVKVDMVGRKEVVRVT